jgi:hypothetical protein
VAVSLAKKSHLLSETETQCLEVLRSRWQGLINRAFDCQSVEKRAAGDYILS